MEEIPERSRQFVELTEGRCRELLGSSHVGRVAWHSDDGLQILPVSYACHQGEIVFRTSPYGALSQLVQPTEVAFEVDELDQQLQTGWSVVVRGRTAPVREPAEMVRVWTIDGLVPWASGTRNLFIRIIPTRISGRTLQSGWQ